MKEHARERGGRCLSVSLKNSKDMLIWECREGHVWRATYKQLNWCPYCAGNIRLTLGEIKQRAKNKGGECLSSSYMNIDSDMRWKCSKGHVWFASTDKAMRYWCPDCSLQGRRKYSVGFCRDLATSRGGKCLSKSYSNSFAKMKWRCSRGHEWNTTLDVLLNQGSWCPVCSSGFGEEACRKILGCLYGKKFIKGRYKWLKSPKGWPLELDGLAGNVAFEYNGPQHYHQMFFSSEDLGYRKVCDKIKVEVCEVRRIKLYVIVASGNKSYLSTIGNVRQQILEQSKFSEKQIDEAIKRAI
jgi:hypothetical protein